MFTNVTTIEITHSYTEQGIDYGIVDARESGFWFTLTLL